MRKPAAGRVRAWRACVTAPLLTAAAQRLLDDYFDPHARRLHAARGEAPAAAGR